jgi:Trypsin-like peptidase domain
MLHKLLLPFLAIGSLFHPSSDPYTRMVNKTEMSIVRITGEKDAVNMFGQPVHFAYVCTGEVIAPGRVLSAAHCVGDNMKADLDALMPLKIDQSLDLALLTTDTHQKPALKLRSTNALQFEQLTAIGYAFGYKDISVLLVTPFLLDASPWTNEDESPLAPGMIVEGEYIGGMSGGPVVDAKGLQVGIIQQGGSGVGYGVEASTIRAFLAAK